MVTNYGPIKLNEFEITYKNNLLTLHQHFILLLFLFIYFISLIFSLKNQT